MVFGDIVTVEELQPSGNKFTSMKLTAKKERKVRSQWAADEEFITMLAASSSGQMKKIRLPG